MAKKGFRVIGGAKAVDCWDLVQKVLQMDIEGNDDAEPTTFNLNGIKFHLSRLPEPVKVGNYDWYVCLKVNAHVYNGVFVYYDGQNAELVIGEPVYNRETDEYDVLEGVIVKAFDMMQ